MRLSLGTYLGSVGSNIVNINLDYYSANHASTYLQLPNSYSDYTCIHSYVIDFLTEFNIATWNGYRYWMAFTPYGLTTFSQEENPTIIASNDGQNWVQPDGISNPIEPLPSSSTYNADVFLYYDKSTSTLYCLWRRINAYLCEKHSTDGVMWTDRVELFQYYTGDGDHSNDKYVSPSIIKIGGQLYGYATSFAADDKLYRYTISALNSWGIPTECTFDKTGSVLNELETYISPTYYKWHSEVRYYKGYYYMIIMYNTGIGSNVYNQLFLAKSKDGLNFKIGKFPLISKFYDTNLASNVGNFAWDMGYYKASIIPYYDGGLKFKLYYVGWGMNDSNQNGYYCGLSTIEEQTTYLKINESSNEISTTRSSELLKANALTDSYVWGDDCNRADSSNINPSSCGKSYTTFITGASFGISGNYIVNSRVGQSGLLFDHGVTDYECVIQLYNQTVQTNTSDNLFYLVPKYGSVTSWILLLEGKKASKALYAQSGGTTKEILRFSRTFKYNELNEFIFRFEGSRLRMWINGIQQFDHTFITSEFKDAAEMATVLAYTKFGIQFLSGTNEKIKNITVKAL